MRWWMLLSEGYENENVNEDKLISFTENVETDNDKIYFAAWLSIISQLIIEANCWCENAKVLFILNSTKYFW